MKADDEWVAGEKASLRLAQGDIDAADRWIEDLGLNRDVSLYVSDQDGNHPIPFNRLIGYMLAARVDIARNRPDDALQLLRPLRKMVEAEGWTLYAARLLILEALALQRQGKVSEAMRPLGRALAMSEPERCMASFLEEGVPMIELLRHAASRGVAPVFVSRLLAHFEAEPSSTPPAQHLPTTLPQIQPLIEPLTERELDVLRLLATPLSTADIADRLFVTVSTVRSHTKNVYAKLNVHRRFDAAERAQELQLI